MIFRRFLVGLYDTISKVLKVPGEWRQRIVVMPR